MTNRNKFILGPSGSGKSFFTNHMVRQYWEQGTHILLVDTGNSYKGLCDLIRRKTNGDDGVYFTYYKMTRFPSIRSSPRITGMTSRSGTASRR